MSALLAASPDISLVAKPLFQAGPIPVNNSMLLGLVGTVTLIGLLAYTCWQVSRRRYTRLAVAVLWGFEALLGSAEEILGSRALARKIMPLAVTIFFFIIVNNWLEVLPLVGPLTWHGQPLFRGMAADLNFTFALALITMVTTQIWAIRRLGLGGDLRRYFADPMKAPIQAFEGFLQLIAEFSRGIALSMRLFGNIFGGEVLLLVVASISSWAAPVALPVFMVFELFIGAVQAYIFFMLTVVFVSLGLGSRSNRHAERMPAVN